jgi:hypothetical protein
MSVKASSPLHGVFVVVDPPPLPPPPPERYQGNLIASLVDTVERTGTPAADPNLRSGPALVNKQDGRNYFRLTQLPSEVEIHCSTVDCDNTARLLIDARDAEVLPYCRACAHVEFAMWMVGV